MTNEELNSLSEEDRYLVVGIEDGWIDPTNKDLERYYELTGVDIHPIRTWLKNLIKQIKGGFEMTKEQSMIHTLAQENEDLKAEISRLRQALTDKSYELWKESYEEEHLRNIRLEEKIKALEQQPCEDCVSRTQAIEWIENLRQMDKCFGNYEDDYFPLSEVIDRLKNVPPVTPTFPKGATNGNMIKAMFPNIEADEIKTDTGGYIEVKYLDTTDKHDATAFRKNWWNAPYKRGNEA